MTYFQSNNSMLIMSNDSFILGLLTGYSVVNNFTLKCISCSKPLSINSLNTKCKAIIIDLRLLAPALVEEHFKSLNYIHQQYAIPICALNSHSTSDSCPIPAWIDKYIDEHFIEKLNSYINKYIIKAPEACAERRDKTRRLVADRRTLSASVPPPLIQKLDGNNSLFDKGIERYFLGDFEIDCNCRAVYLKGKDLELTTKEFKLFILLAEDIEHVCTTEKIIKNLWPNTHRANKSDLYQYMHLLRKKVEQDPDNPHWILTIKGVGYKLHTREHWPC